MLMLRRPHDRQAPRRHRFESEEAMRRGGEALNAVPEAGTHLGRVRRGPGARARLSIVPRLAFGPTCTAQSDVRIHRPQAEDGAHCRGERAPRPQARPEPTPGRDPRAASLASSRRGVRRHRDDGARLGRACGTSIEHPFVRRVADVAREVFGAPPSTSGTQRASRTRC
jgi:hypothetical protein